MIANLSARARAILQIVDYERLMDEARRGEGGGEGVAKKVVKNSL